MTRQRDDTGFLGRWSARKRGASDIDEPPLESTAEPAGGTTAAPAADKTDDEILQELGLPDPDSLGKNDDFTAFMKAAVPARLRNRALRRLWLTDPVLANLDELVDYGGDFTDAATVVENLQTAYRVGRGLLRDEPKDAAEAARETESGDLSGPEDGEGATAETEAAEPVQTGADQPNPPAQEDPPAVSHSQSMPELPTQPRQRHMRFRFDDV